MNINKFISDNYRNVVAHTAEQVSKLSNRVDVSNVTTVVVGIMATLALAFLAVRCLRSKAVQIETESPVYSLPATEKMPGAQKSFSDKLIEIYDAKRKNVKNDEKQSVAQRKDFLVNFRASYAARLQKLVAKPDTQQEQKAIQQQSALYSIRFPAAYEKKFHPDGDKLVEDVRNLFADESDTVQAPGIVPAVASASAEDALATEAYQATKKSDYRYVAYVAGQFFLDAMTLF